MTLAGTLAGALKESPVLRFSNSDVGFAASAYLTGAVLKGSAGRYAEIDLQLFPESAKEVEIFLVDRGIPYSSSEVRRYAGDRARAVAQLSLSWKDTPLRVSVFDPRDERLSLKVTPGGKVLERADIGEVSALLEFPAPADAQRLAG